MQIGMVEQGRMDANNERRRPAGGRTGRPWGGA